jgi:hypothetical protein
MGGARTLFDSRRGRLAHALIAIVAVLGAGCRPSRREAPGPP